MMGLADEISPIHQINPLDTSVQMIGAFQNAPKKPRQTGRMTTLETRRNEKRGKNQININLD